MTEHGDGKETARRIGSGLASEDEGAEVGVLGIPFDGGASYRRGARMAPARLRQLSRRLSPCAEEGQPLQLRVRDYGDVTAGWDQSLVFREAEGRARLALRHPLALFLGGDHSVSIPLMRAFATVTEGDFGVLHLDAHPDLFDTYQGVRWSHACTARRALELEGLDPRHLVFVGLCSIARCEWDYLQAHRDIGYTTVRQCHLQGIQAIAEQVVDRLRDVPAVYLTLDIDVLDGAHAPGTGYPEGVGLSTREVLELLRVVVRELPVRAMDVVEVAPPLDPTDITSFTALKIIYETWAEHRRIYEQS
jgi:agmatinase